MAINTFSIHFVTPLDKTNKKGLTPIYARVRINGVKVEITTNRYIEIRHWIKNKEQAIPLTEELKQLNEHLQLFKTKLYTTWSKFQLQEEKLTAASFKEALKGKEIIKPITHTLIEVTTEHNIQFEKQVGKKYSFGSYKNYKTTLKYFKEFVPSYNGMKDITLNDVGYKFCEAYFNWLTTQKGCHTNGANKQIQRLKKILNYAILSNYLQTNPASSYSLEFKPNQKVALTTSELESLQSLSLKRDTLREVRDVFLFQCYTGLSYGDVYRLSKHDIHSSDDGALWIKMKREKTGISFSVPLLQPALVILTTYCQFQGKQDKLFPMLSNQKMNDNLKVIQELAGISKSLSTHLARHTFATTITLSNGVPIETVSRMLGHTKLATTQVYAKVIDTKIEADMKNLANKLNPSNSSKN